MVQNGLPAVAPRKTGKVFFLPVRILSRVFRGKFIELLKQAFTDEQLAFHGRIEHLSDSIQFEKLLTAASRHNWVVHAKPPFGGPTQVMRYPRPLHTSRCDFRSSSAFRQQRNSQFSLEGLRRWQPKQSHDACPHGNSFDDFCCNVLPKGFTRIRYYGLLGNRYRSRKLEQCRFLIRTSEAAENPVQTSSTKAIVLEDPVCPHCKTGHMQIVERIDPPFASIRRPHFPGLNRAQAPVVRDTS